MKHTATYSPDDNKLRIYPAYRLDKDGEYKTVKDAGYAWAPKQECFYAVWSPEREDVALELCGEIDDEDKSLVDRAEERAERFEGYQENRTRDAERAHAAVSAIADNIPLGQPILVGHHSERHARRDAEKIENGMRKAVKMWDTAQYWKSRAAGAIRAAKYKERPDVRARRIKTIEAELRSEIASYTPQPGHPQILQHGWDSDQYTPVEPHAWCGPKGRGGRWVPVRALPMIEKRAQRWIAHYENRLAYERAMLAEGGGLKADAFDIKPGGQVQRRGTWYPVLKLNTRDGVTLSVSVVGHWQMTIPIEEISDYRAPKEGDAAKVAKIMQQPPLVNWRAPGCVEMTMAKWKDCTRWSDTYYVATFAADHTHTWGKVRDGQQPILYRQRSLSGTAHNWKRVPVFITDAKEVQPPAAPTEPREPIRFEGAGREPLPSTVWVEPKEDTPAPPADFEAMRESLKAGVQVVSAPQLFPTPPEIAERMVEYAKIERGETVLEPSAGTGNILAAIRSATGGGAVRTAVEINGKLCDMLRRKEEGADIIQADFLDWSGGPFDVILMNPPFENGADIKHIEHARTMLAPGGRLVAICANGPRQAAKLQDEAETWEELPAGTFEGTNVRAVLLTMSALPDPPKGNVCICGEPIPDDATSCGQHDAPKRKPRAARTSTTTQAPLFTDDELNARIAKIRANLDGVGLTPTA